MKIIRENSLLPELVIYTVIVFTLSTVIYLYPSFIAFFAEKNTIVSVENIYHLEALLSEHNLDLEELNITSISQKLEATNLPDDLPHFSAKKRATLFIGFLLPHIQKCNGEILQQRKKLQKYIRDHNEAKYISRQRKSWLKKLAKKYHLAHGTPEQLLLRVDVIPTSLALAQAINESGWGTSRFARQGNALYGQHLSRGSNRKFIVSLYDNVKVAAFASLYEGTASYIHNLNSSKAYATLRRIRNKQRLAGQNPQDHTLASGLEHYSEIGSSYISDIRNIIKKYTLQKYDIMPRRQPATRLAIRFNRKKQRS